MAPWIENAQDELAFFAGFHDGDGNKSGDRNVQIHQAEDNSQVLDRLSELFGGSVRPKADDKRGNRAPSRVLYIGVRGASEYARALAPYSLQSRKRVELEVLAATPHTVPRKIFSERILAVRHITDDDIDDEAARARMTPAQIDAYFAGFFFADGSVGSMEGTGVRFAISQKDTAILRFAERYFGCGNIHPPSDEQRASNWVVYGTASKALAARIAHLLPPGSAKREATELARDITKENAESTGARLSALAGNKPSGTSRKKNAKGCISKHKIKGVLVGYYARFLKKRQGFTSKTKTPEENRALAEACLAEFARERDEELAAEEVERARAAGCPTNA